MARLSEPHEFPPNTVLLSCELKSYMCGSLEFVFWTSEGVQAAGVEEEVDVTDAKGGGIFGGHCGTFSRAQQKEETDNQHVCNGVGGLRLRSSAMHDSGME